MQITQRITISGTNDLLLDTSALEYSAFLTQVGLSVSCNYTIQSQDRVDYEKGTGSITAGGVFARTTQTASSNGGAKVNFKAGSHLVVIDEISVGGGGGGGLTYSQTLSTAFLQ